MKRQVFHGKKSFNKHREGSQRELDNNDVNGVKGGRRCCRAKFISLDPKDGDMTGRIRLFDRLKEKGKSPIILHKCSCRITRKEYNRAWFKRGDDPVRKFVEIP